MNGLHIFSNNAPIVAFKKKKKKIGTTLQLKKEKNLGEFKEQKMRVLSIRSSYRCQDKNETKIYVVVKTDKKARKAETCLNSPKESFPCHRYIQQ